MFYLLYCYRVLIKHISDVKKEDMKEIGSKYVRTLLDTTLVKTAVVCHTSKVEEVANGLKQ